MRKSHEDRKAEIIQATLDVAADAKSRKITTQIIADKLQISQPTIFKHFKNNDTLFLAVFEWVAGKIFANFDKGQTQEGNRPQDEVQPKAQLEYLLMAQVSFMNRNPGVARLIFSDHVYKGPQQLKTVIQKIMAMYIQRLSGVIADGVHYGQFRADIDPDVAARLMVSTLQGVIVRWSVHDFVFDLPAEVKSLLPLLMAALERSE
ncbi:MAG: hypothetical protein COB54_04615 [Alphaproteobacteria bacterium]|nr:MAG: hypothetical protein COB54_04615 [Alphaproteobacteria bacterium]